MLVIESRRPVRRLHGTVLADAVGRPALKQLGGGQASPDLGSAIALAKPIAFWALWPHGITHWRRLLWLDMGFPAVYAALFVLLGAKWAQFVGAGPGWQACAIGFPTRRRSVTTSGTSSCLGRRRAAGSPRCPITAASLFTQGKFSFLLPPCHPADPLGAGTVG